MGCDIHIHVERLVDGKWTYVTKPDCCPDNTNEWHVDDWYHGRCYTLFGMLAGVRDYEFHPFVDPRGVPKDCSEQYRDVVEDWDTDGHTHSWYKLRELYDAHWEQSTDANGDPCPADGGFVEQTIPLLEAVGKPDEVRMLFFFDN